VSLLGTGQALRAAPKTGPALTAAARDGRTGVRAGTKEWLRMVGNRRSKCRAITPPDPKFLPVHQTGVGLELAILARGPALRGSPHPVITQFKDDKYAIVCYLRSTRTSSVRRTTWVHRSELRPWPLVILEIIAMIAVICGALFWA
jgi:preprotein translocase subunit SecE